MKKHLTRKNFIALTSAVTFGVVMAPAMNIWQGVVAAICMIVVFLNERV